MEIAPIVHMVTEPTRFRLLRLLLERHYCVKALAKKLGISESAVSQHIRLLKECQLVSGVKIGYQMHYKVNRERIIFCLDGLSREIAGYPLRAAIHKDADCSCEFISDCIKRDS